MKNKIFIRRILQHFIVERSVGVIKIFPKVNPYTKMKSFSKTTTKHFVEKRF